MLFHRHFISITDTFTKLVGFYAKFGKRNSVAGGKNINFNDNNIHLIRKKAFNPLLGP